MMLRDQQTVFHLWIRRVSDLALDGYTTLFNSLWHMLVSRELHAQLLCSLLLVQ